MTKYSQPQRTATCARIAAALGLALGLAASGSAMAGGITAADLKQPTAARPFTSGAVLVPVSRTLGPSPRREDTGPSRDEPTTNRMPRRRVADVRHPLMAPPAHVATSA